MSHGKRYTELKKLVDPKKLYAPREAMDLAKKTSNTKFDGTIEIHVNLGIDVKKGEEQVRSTITLPHASGKVKKIAAFVGAAKEQDAKDAGADKVGGEELIDEVMKSGKIDFDIAVATPDMMPKLAKIAKILGPIGLMPNPKTETVGPNVKKMIEELKKGKLAFKNDTTGNLHIGIGKSSMSVEQLVENYQALVEAVRKTKPASSKGTFLQSITVTSTMGPGIKIDPGM
jgi:large subunit ribosomal protein L1